MSDDTAKPRQDDHDAPRSWIERISQAFSAEPRDREALLEMLRDARIRGVLGADVLAMLEGAMQVSDLRVRDIMVPRADMSYVQRDAAIADMLPAMIESGHSRFPVIGDDRDEVVGIVLAKDLLRLCLAEPPTDFGVRDILRPAVMVPESKRLNVLLADFRRSRIHMAIVVDEFSSVSGLVTIEDVLEQIAGEIDDEHDVDEDEGDIRRYGANRYGVKARTPVEEFNAYFDAALDTREFDTIGGIVSNAFGHVPQRGESITLEGMDIKVLRADSRRLHLLRVSLQRG